MLLLFSILMLVHPCSMSMPQWEYFEKLMLPYACTGKLDWTYDIKNINLRLLIAASRIILCPWHKAYQMESLFKLRVRFFNEIYVFLRDVRQRPENFKCLNSGLRIAIERFFCSQPEDIENVFSIFVKHSKDIFCLQNERKIPNRFLCKTTLYMERMDIRKKMYTLLDKIGACPEEFKVIRKKRQFDTSSSLLL